MYKYRKEKEEVAKAVRLPCKKAEIFLVYSVPFSEMLDDLNSKIFFLDLSAIPIGFPY